MMPSREISGLEVPSKPALVNGCLKAGPHWAPSLLPLGYSLSFLQPVVAVGREASRPNPAIREMAWIAGNLSLRRRPALAQVVQPVKQNNGILGSASGSADSAISRRSSHTVEKHQHRERSTISRVLLIVAGSVSTGVGIAAIFVPLLPTTPFLLLAAACYVRSSDRLYHWLLNHRWTGTYIRNYREGRGMPRRAKIVTIAILWISLAISAWVVAHIWVWVFLAAVAIGVPWFILSLPTLRE